MSAGIVIAVADPTAPHVGAILREHLAEMYATSPACSVHALEPEALAVPSVTFFTAEREGEVIACGAIRALADGGAELKSMRTARSARGAGVGSYLLEHLLAEARKRGFSAVLLETGVEDHFAPARRLYLRHGFVETEPFGEYLPDPSSVFMRLAL